MFGRLPVIVLILILSRVTLAQLASTEADANDKLVAALLELDELGTSYCAKFQGTMSKLSRGEPKLTSIYGFSAVSNLGPPARFSSWGSVDGLGNGFGESPDTLWCEALRFGKDQKRFRVVTGGAGSDRRALANLETREQLEKNPNATWQYPELDPFSLVFGHEGDLIGQASNFARKMKTLTESYVLAESKFNDKRNVVGTWISTNKKAIVIIEFDKTINDLPIMFKYLLRDIDTGKVLSTIATTTTKWQPYAGKNHFAPRTIVITGERYDKSDVEIEFTWDWIDPKDWAKHPIKFDDTLADCLNLRKPFLELFANKPDLQKKRR